MPHGYNGVIPHLTISGGRGGEAADFYARAFGAEEKRRMPADDGKRLMHCHLQINGEDVFLNDDFPEYRGGGEAVAPGGVTLHLQVDEVDTWWARATEAGCEVTMPLADQFWGDKYGQVRDPFGHSWSLASPSKEQAA